jgi:hypothetical protein
MASADVVTAHAKAAKAINRIMAFSRVLRGRRCPPPLDSNSPQGTLMQIKEKNSHLQTAPPGPSRRADLAVSE